jgi:hypothetical protein
MKKTKPEARIKDPMMIRLYERNHFFVNGFSLSRKNVMTNRI